MGLKIALILAFLLPCVVYSAQSEDSFDSDDADTDLMTRITGGVEKRNRYTVSLQQRVKPNVLRHFAGGAFINELYVVTCARCVKNKKKWQIRVVGGVRSWKSFSRRRDVFRVKKITIHPNFTKINGNTPESDIALIRLQQPVILSNKMKKVDLPVQGATVAEDKKVAISGWGKLDENDADFPELLHKANMRVVSHDKCRSIYEAVGLQITDNMICAASAKDYGPCEGDEGGPLMKRGTIVGITSWYHECGTKDFPAVFVDIAQFIDWIRDNLLP